MRKRYSRKPLFVIVYTKHGELYRCFCDLESEKNGIRVGTELAAVRLLPEPDVIIKPLKLD